MSTRDITVAAAVVLGFAAFIYATAKGRVPSTVWTGAYGGWFFRVGTTSESLWSALFYLVFGAAMIWAAIWFSRKEPA